jgi:metal-dependent amidase/aminoacylase/carboxypeptidase family protein
LRVNPEEFPPNHSPRFVLDEDALVVGVRLLSYLAVDHLTTERGE